jgi:biopolymer transport protein ExbD
MPDFIVYLPKPAPPDAVETPAEPLEPVHTEFGWKRRPDDEDAEVDMIPLIDVSLVLLIFFMITMTDVSGGGSPIDTPAARNATASTNPDSVWVGIDLVKNDQGDLVKNDKGEPALVYSLGVGDKTTEAGLPTRATLLDRLGKVLADRNEPVELTIKANRAVRTGEVRQLTVDLQEASFRDKILRKYTGVTEKKQ